MKQTNIAICLELIEIQLTLNLSPYRFFIFVNSAYI